VDRRKFLKGVAALPAVGVADVFWVDEAAEIPQAAWDALPKRCTFSQIDFNIDAEKCSVCGGIRTGLEAMEGIYPCQTSGIEPATWDYHRGPS